MSVYINSTYMYYLDKGLCGNLGAKPEMLRTKDNTPYARATLYCNFKPDATTHQAIEAQSQESHALRITLMFFGETAKKAYDNLEMGDFIAIHPDSIGISYVVDDETGKASYRFSALLGNVNYFTILKHRCDTAKKQQDVEVSDDSALAEGTS